MTGSVVVHGLTFSALSVEGQVPFYGSAHAAFLPGSTAIEGCAVAEMLQAATAAPTTQERLTVELHQTLTRSLAPRGLLIVLLGRHPGMRSGTPSSGVPEVMTHARSGVFNDAGIREDVWRFIRRT